MYNTIFLNLFNVQTYRIKNLIRFNNVRCLDCVAGESVEILLEHSTKLVELFQYPWEAILLMYINLKYAGANPEEVVRRMVDGKVYFVLNLPSCSGYRRVKIMAFSINHTSILSNVQKIIYHYNTTLSLSNTRRWKVTISSSSL